MIVLLLLSSSFADVVFNRSLCDDASLQNALLQCTNACVSGPLKNLSTCLLVCSTAHDSMKCPSDEGKNKFTDFSEILYNLLVYLSCFIFLYCNFLS